MDEANEGKRNLSGMEKLSLQTNRNPRDLLQMFMASSNPSRQQGETSQGNEEEEDIELNLGLSMGGRFGVDKTAKKKLMRSSSIAGSIPIVRDRGGDNEVGPPPVSNPTLARTSSLPAETEEEWRKRKELQTLRRMAAKRRRSEKQRNMKGEKDGGAGAGGGGSLGEERRCRLPTWAASAARQALIAGSKGNYVGGSSGGGGGALQPSGSVESLGGSSSVLSESESRSFQGSSSCSEASPTSIQSLQEAVGSSGSKGKGKNARKFAGGEMEEEEEEVVVEKQLGRREMGLNSLEDMPGVFTQGEGPNGRRIEGILYKYGKGEEVKIMCVCHGSFLSPAEFVKHAGGGDVAHPLKHIVVNPSSSSSLS